MDTLKVRPPFLATTKTTEQNTKKGFEWYIIIANLGVLQCQKASP